jgi:hypothetical protein
MRTMLVSAALVFGAGCASMDDVRNDRSGGTTGAYAGPVEDVLRAASKVLKRQGVEAVEQESGALFGTIPESFLGDVSSTYCGVWVEATEDGTVEVRVVTRRRRSLSLLTGLTETTFHEELRRELGRPSPVSEGGLTGR